jgi:hypothetical protein
MKLQLIFVIFLFYFFSCSNKNSDKGTSNEIDTTQIPREVITASNKHFSINPWEVFGQYAINYTPIQTGSTANIDLPKLNDTLKFAIDSLFIVDTSNLKLWTVLILIKQYSHHLDCCNQGYDIRNGYDKNGNLDKENNPVIYTFLRLTNQLEKGSIRNEFLNSFFIYRYLLEHRELIKNKLILPYFTKVDKIEKDAEKKLKQEESKKKNNH